MERAPPRLVFGKHCARIHRLQRSMQLGSPRKATAKPLSEPWKDLRMNAIKLLKEDHKKVRGLLAELESTTSRGTKKRAQLLATIATELRVHTKIEEEIFYPALRAAGEKNEDEKMYFEALEEHRAAGELVLPDLEKTAPDSEQFSGRAKVLKELVEHHADEEEKEMFPRARKLLSAAELVSLGERMATRKQELLAAPSGMVAKAAGAVLDAISPREDDEDGLPEVSAAARKRSANGRGTGARTR
jgi:hemerythrin-like domain-containing protein